MGKAKNRTKQKHSKAAKSRLLDGDTVQVDVAPQKDDPNLLIERALELFRSGDAVEAKKLAKRVVKKCDSAQLLEDCGALLAECGEETMAQEAMRRAVTLEPESSHAKYITLGQLATGAESLKYLTKGIELLKREAPENIRALSSAYCNIGELYMTDLCQETNAQRSCHEATKAAIGADSTNPEAYHLAASYFISSRQFDAAKGELMKSLAMWLDEHETENDDDDKTEEEIIDEISKRKMDPELRMNALRLAIELEMWDESIKIARQLSEENYENCEPRYFLAFSLLRLYQTTTDTSEQMNIKIDCYEAAMDTKKLAEKGWTQQRDQTAKAILEQVDDLLEDLGPVQQIAQSSNNDDGNWETDDDEEEVMES